MYTQPPPTEAAAAFMSFSSSTQFSNTHAQLRNTSKSTGLFYITSKRPSVQQTIDIICIHGFNGHYRNSYTSKKSGANWLRDFLPKHVPEARIMSWGYNSEVLGRDGEDWITKWAEGFMLDLEFARTSARAGGKVKGEEKRPLVVVAYSLGGVVFKRALNLASERQSLHQATIESMKGAIFFGTPHGGSGLGTLMTDIAMWSKMAYVLRKEEQIMESLKQLRYDILDTSQAFMESGKCLLKVYSVYEGKKLGVRVINKDSAHIGLPHEELIPMVADHWDVCQFATGEDENYKLLLSCVRNLVDAIAFARRNRHGYEWPSYFEAQKLREVCWREKMVKDWRESGR